MRIEGTLGAYLADEAVEPGLHGKDPQEDGVEEVVAPLEGVPHLLVLQHLEVRRVHVRLVDLGCRGHGVCIMHPHSSSSSSRPPRGGVS